MISLFKTIRIFFILGALMFLSLSCAQSTETVDIDGETYSKAQISEDINLLLEVEEKGDELFARWRQEVVRVAILGATQEEFDTMVAALTKVAQAAKKRISVEDVSEETHAVFVFVDKAVDILYKRPEWAEKFMLNPGQSIVALRKELDENPLYSHEYREEGVFTKGEKVGQHSLLFYFDVSPRTERIKSHDIYIYTSMALGFLTDSVETKYVKSSLFNKDLRRNKTCEPPCAFDRAYLESFYELDLSEELTRRAAAKRLTDMVFSKLNQTNQHG